MGMRETLGISDSRVQRFAKAAEGKTKEEVRDLERALLKPDVLTPFTGKKPPKSSVEQRTVKIIFETDEDMELFRQFFRVNAFKEQNTRELGPIIALVDALNRDVVRYNQQTQTLNFVDEQGEEWPL
jgi:hypothetical protein